MLIRNQLVLSSTFTMNKSLMNLNFIEKMNISFKEFCFLKRFSKDKDRNYTILDCDKNIGTVI